MCLNICLYRQFFLCWCDFFAPSSGTRAPPVPHSKPNLWEGDSSCTMCRQYGTHTRDLYSTISACHFACVKLTYAYPTVLMKTVSKSMTTAWQKHDTMGIFMRTHLLTNIYVHVTLCAFAHKVCVLLLEHRYIYIYTQMPEEELHCFSAFTYQRQVSVGRNSHVLPSLFITRKNVQAFCPCFFSFWPEDGTLVKTLPPFEFSSREVMKISFETKSQPLLNGGKMPLYEFWVGNLVFPGS